MKHYLKSFTGDEDGAVTVDWVVLTAAIVGLGVAAFNTATEGVSTVAENIKNGVAEQPIGVE